MEIAEYEDTVIPDRTFPINVFRVAPAGQDRIPLHWHDHLEWMLVRRGEYRVQLGSASYELGEGDLLFANSRELHAAYPLRSDAELIAVVFNEALLRNSSLDRTEREFVLPILNREIAVPGILRANHPAAGAIAECLERVDAEYREKRCGYELFVKADLLRAIALLLRSSGDELPVARAGKEETPIQNVLGWIGDRFREPVAIEEAASFCSLSPNYFCFLFKRSTGKTFTEYVNLLRVHEAERLLLAGRPVGEAARLSGFANLTYFGRVFKQLKSMRPSEVRKRAKEQTRAGTDGLAR